MESDNIRLVYTVAEVSQLLMLGKVSTYEAIRRNEIPHLKFGRRILIPRAALHRFLESAGNPPEEARLPIPKNLNALDSYDKSEGLKDKTKLPEGDEG